MIFFGIFGEFIDIIQKVVDGPGVRFRNMKTGTNADKTKTKNKRKVTKKYQNNATKEEIIKQN